MKYLCENRTKMRVKKIKKCLERSFKARKYNNLVEAVDVSKGLRKIAGVIVIDLVNSKDGIVNKFSFLGFIFFVLWHSLYFYCTYKSYTEDQTIVRNMYSTKMQRYGDDTERLASVVYVILAMWKIPFCISGNFEFVQIVIDVDKALENLGEKIKYNIDSFSAALISIAQIAVYGIRLFTIWLTLRHLDVVIPIERMYQMVFTDTLALIVTAYYCYFLTVLKLRFQYTNKILLEIKDHKAWEYKLFTRGRMTMNVQRAGSLQDKYVCEKLRSCAKVYGMLYKIVNTVNSVFGLILVMTMFVCLIYIILYLFYFMEATTSGLFHDLPKYIDFIIYVFWQIGYAIGILYLIVYFCECVKFEAREAAFIVHEILSSDLGPAVKTEALQLSLQLLHQKPVLTAFGLYKLNYALFEQGARSVSTYLVMLLQFLTDASF